MDDNRIIIILKINNNELPFDLDIPLTSTVNDLLIALNRIFSLNLDESIIDSYYLKSENPIRLLKGNNTLIDYGLHNGSIVFFNN